MVWAFDRALIQIDVARRQGRLRVAARILGRVVSIVEPVERDRRRQIEPQRFTWFELFSPACLDQHKP